MLHLTRWQCMLILTHQGNLNLRYQMIPCVEALLHYGKWRRLMGVCLYPSFLLRIDGVTHRASSCEAGAACRPHWPRVARPRRPGARRCIRASPTPEKRSQVSEFPLFPSAAHHGCQSERTINWRSGAAGSFVRSDTRNSCGPPMPSCIVNAKRTLVDIPGWMVASPTTAAGGQHPFTALTTGSSKIFRTLSPTFDSVNTASVGAL
jgi:hypothetical protein